MTIKNTFLTLLALGAVVITGLPADAQYNYYTSPQYQAEEQAFRARQNEGARIHETFGENSPQYMNWHFREKGTIPYGYGYNGFMGQPYYGNARMYSNSFNRRTQKKIKKQVKKQIKQYRRR